MRERDSQVRKHRDDAREDAASEHAVCGPEARCVSLLIPRAVLQPGPELLGQCPEPAAAPGWAQGTSPGAVCPAGAGTRPAAFPPVLQGQSPCLQPLPPGSQGCGVLSTRCSRGG